MGIEEKIQKLQERKAELRQGGGAERVEKQHQSGKLTARERIERVADPNSFQEFGMFAKHRATEFGMAGKEFPADGVVTGAAQVDGRLIHLASQDFTVGGGSAGEVHSDKVAEAMRLSLKTGSPFVFINDSGGARVQEGIDSLAGYGRVFYSNVMLSGAVPQIALICGPCAGGAAYSPALTDFIIQTKGAQMFITGPSVIKQVTGEVVTSEQLGGPAAQMSYSGVVHFIAENDEDAASSAGGCFRSCRRTIWKIRRGFRSTRRSRSIRPELRGTGRSEAGLRHAQRAGARARSRRFSGSAAEFRAEHHRRLRPAARADGRHGRESADACMAGALDINASDKAARFIRFCNAFNIPLANPRGCPRIPAGRSAGVRRDHPARCKDAVRVFGRDGAEDDGDHAKGVRRGLHRDVRRRTWGPIGSVAWPTAEIAVMGAEGAAEIVFRKEIAKAEDKKAKRQEKIATIPECFRESICSGRRGGWWTTSSNRRRLGGIWWRRWKRWRRSGSSGRRRSTV